MRVMLTPEEVLRYQPDEEVAAEKVAAERARANRERRKDEFLLRVLDDPAGRAFLWDLLAECSIFELGFSPGFPDQTAFAVGRRSIGVPLYERLMRLDPGAYSVMLEESRIPL